MRPRVVTPELDEVDVDDAIEEGFESDVETLSLTSFVSFTSLAAIDR